MKFNFPNPLRAALSCIVLFFFFSCSNDLDETEELSVIQYQAKTSQTVTLTPIYDAFLQGSKSYNSSIVRLEESKRTGYLMFDLSKIEGEITSANLEFTISSDPGYGTIEAHLGDGSNWTDTNLSSKNKPNPNTFLGSINKSYKLGSKEKISLKADSFSADKATLILSHKNGNDLAFASSQTSLSPKLTVTYSSTNTGNVTETDKIPEFSDPNAVNFSKYGAVGDGKADDTRAIQA
ncbi:CBM96 family carbohydrate-binding protein, partial [Arenibacter certesii]|uniref:CBM96 family carbohydrate-binding protein n=1 Tax=Arenibacter certesii TaxID=228955 RepID=UPI00402B2F7D